MISQQTAMDIAMAYREVATAETLLAKIIEDMGRRAAPGDRGGPRQKNAVSAVGRRASAGQRRQGQAPRSCDDAIHLREVNMMWKV